ncbi:glycosyltransferase family 4 protein [Patescibacteria group bacterium]
MKIGVDIRFLAEGKRTGVEEYALNLLSALFIRGEKHQFKLFTNYWQGEPHYLNKLGSHKNVTIYRFRYPNKILNTSFIARKKPFIDELLKGCDVFFYPNIIFGAVSRNCPIVTTFHDLSFELHPEFLSLKKRIWHRLVKPQYQAEISARIIAVSGSTKKDLVEQYNVPPGKIKIVHSGINRPPDNLNERSLKVKTKYKLPDRFVLFFGTLEPRKNVLGVFSAFTRLKESGKIKGYKLVIAGSPGWLDRQFWSEVNRSDWKKDIQHIGFVEQADKLALFSLADVFVFPSFYEGFGFPPLEAMSVGTPVITSSISSLPEVVGDAALLVNPYNHAEIAKALEELLEDDELRRQLIKRGWQRTANFSWQQTAEQTLAVLGEAANI